MLRRRTRHDFTFTNGICILNFIKYIFDVIFSLLNVIFSGYYFARLFILNAFWEYSLDVKLMKKFVKTQISQH